MYLIFNATKINKKFKIPESFIDLIPVFKNLSKFGQNNNGKNLIYTYNEEITIRAMKAYCEIKQCQKVKSLNEDIFSIEPMNTIDWIYLLNLICLLGDFILLGEGDSVFDITRYVPSVYEVYPYIDKMEPEIFAKYSEDYIYDIFIRDREEDLLNKYKNEPIDFIEWLYKIPTKIYDESTIVDFIIFGNIIGIQNLIRKMTDLTSFHYELTIEDYDKMILKWESLQYIQQIAYSKITIKNYLNKLMKIYNILLKIEYTKEFEDCFLLPRSNFHNDFKSFFSCLPDIAEIFWSTPEYKKQLLQIVYIPNKKQNFVKKATYHEMIELLTKESNLVIDEKERILRRNLTAAKNAQKILEKRGRFFANDTEDVIIAREELNAYRKTKEKEKQKMTSNDTTNNLIFYKPTKPIKILCKSRSK